jgi:isoleucyl-tRNA synthetase
MALVRRLVELGRAARAESGQKTRQPLARALVSAPGWEQLPDELRSQLAEELNVRVLDRLSTAGDLVDVTFKGNFRVLGRSFGKQTPVVAEAIAAGRLREHDDGWLVSLPDGGDVEVAGDAVLRTETPRSGWAVSSAGAETVALDLELTDELRRAGTVREVIRLVQEARKGQGFDVSDRIELWWSAADGPTADAVREGTAALAGEVLAVSCTEGTPNAPLAPHQVDELGLTFWLRAVD